MEEVQELSKDQKIGIRIIFSILGLAVVASVLNFYDDIPTNAVSNREMTESAFVGQSSLVSKETSDSQFDKNAEIYGDVSTSEGGLIYVVDPDTEQTMVIDSPRFRSAPEGEIVISGTLDSYTMKLKVDEKVVAVYDSRTGKTKPLLEEGSWSQLAIVP